MPPSNDVLLAYDVLVGNHNQMWFGAYQPSSCEAAVVFVGAQGFEVAPTYDLLIATSDDGVTPSGPAQNIGNSLPGGTPGTWVTIRRVSAHSGSSSFDYQEPIAPYLLVGVFANQAQRFVAEVHCARAYP